MFNFVFDRRNDSRPYPNLAPMMHNPHESYHGMGDVFPFIAPCRLLLYCQDHDYPVSISYIDEPLPSQALYPVGLAWFDYSLDYFDMMSAQVHSALKKQQMRVLFYYHEGDSPILEKQRLDLLCQQHGLPRDCYLFVSGNTKAGAIENFVYFPDHELFYWRNAVKWNDRSMPGCTYHERQRRYQFTALNRLHKWWRATVMSDLHRRGFLNQSIWSYNNVDMGDHFHDNPIQITAVDNLESCIHKFLSGAPYHCDHLSAQEHNNHWTLVPEHYDESYCHLVLETLYDAEQSGGAFITEKTFKPIRHAQPFVIFGTPGSLQILRDLGYRTFDYVMDNSYDQELDNTKRYQKTLVAIEQLTKISMHQWYVSCKDDILHNQQLFLGSKHDRLNNLFNMIHND